MKATIAIMLLFLSSNVYSQSADCGIYGDKHTVKFQQLDSLKNRSSKAGAKIDKSITLEKILAPGNDRERYNCGQYVSLTGYVILVKDGGSETCNCHSKKKEDLDIHIEIALDKGADNKHAMIVEINRYTKAQHPEYTTQALKALIGQKVTIEGFLFSDEEHWQNAVNTNDKGGDLWRDTIWEVHPVLKIAKAK